MGAFLQIAALPLRAGALPGFLGLGCSGQIALLCLNLDSFDFLIS
jgi:hypothetical protein